MDTTSCDGFNMLKATDADHNAQVCFDWCIYNFAVLRDLVRSPVILSPVKNLISQRCHGEIMIYSQLPLTITLLQHHLEAAHLTNHDINW